MTLVLKLKYTKSSRFRNALLARASGIRLSVITDTPTTSNVVLTKKIELALRLLKKLPVMQFAIWNIRPATVFESYTKYTFSSYDVATPKTCTRKINP